MSSQFLSSQSSFSSPSNHVIQTLSDPLSFPFDDAKLHLVPAAQDNICWLIEYMPGKVAVVDGPDASSVDRYCQAYNLNLTHILNTHIHGDHIGINRSLQKRGVLDQLEVWGSATTADQIPGLTRSFKEGDPFELGELKGEVWLTEGHLNGHISWIFNGVLFCGDTLFAGGCGYLFDGPPSKMHTSLQRFASLPPDTLVCCAHEYTLDNLHFALSIEPQSFVLRQRIADVIQIRSELRSTLPSTIGLECQTNPFIRSNSPSIQEAVNCTYPLADVFARTRLLKDQKLYRQKTIQCLLDHD